MPVERNYLQPTYTHSMSFSAGQFALLGLIAFALTGLFLWPVTLLAIRIGVMDKPNLERQTITLF